MRTKTKKATFNLRTDILAALDEIMAQGLAPSKNELVERALRNELKELRRQAKKALWQEAAKDLVFLKDLERLESDFREADTETAGGLV